MLCITTFVWGWCDVRPTSGIGAAAAQGLCCIKGWPVCAAACVSGMLPTSDRFFKEAPACMQSSSKGALGNVMFMRGCTGQQACLSDLPEQHA